MHSLSPVVLVVFARFSAGFSHLNTGVQEPPACSRFECEYKILERLIKLELERDGLMTEVRTLKGKVDEQSNLIRKLENEMSRQRSGEGVSVKRQVAVKVRLSRDVTLKMNDRLIYDLIVSNEGNAYDPQSGIFRAAVNATYIFSITACAKNSEWFVLDIIKDGTTVIGQLRVGDGEYKNCNAEVTTDYLTAGSSIWVVRAENDISGLATGIQQTVYWNSLTVALVN